MKLYLIVSICLSFPLFSADIIPHSFMDPARAQRIVSSIEHVELQELPEIIRMKDPKVKFPYNTVVLHGDPGVGKSTIMKAVATLVGTDWGVHFISQKDLNVDPGKRNASMAAFCAAIEMAAQDNENNLILMNEFHGFLNHFNSEHHDTDTLSIAIQDTLDAYLDKQNMFFIATVNEFDKVAQPIKDRLELSMFKITGFGNQEAANAEFFEQIDSRNYILSADDREYLKIRFEETREKPRAARLLADRICLRAYVTRDKQAGIVTITQANIDHIVDQRIQSRASIKIDEPIEKDEERRHRENKEMSERHYQEQKQIHADEKEIDNLRADYNTFLSILSTRNQCNQGHGIRLSARQNSLVGRGVASLSGLLEHEFDDRFPMTEAQLRDRNSAQSVEDSINYSINNPPTCSIQ